MVSVRINGEEASCASTNETKITDLVELVKAGIDPDHMITAILFNGNDLEEQQWAARLGQLGEGTIEIKTGAPDCFVNERLQMTAPVLRECFLEFRESRKCFQGGKMLSGNQRLAKGVNTLKTFFEWYQTLLQLVPAERQEELKIDSYVNNLSDILKRITQQQLYQSWWALGETISRELEPQLDQLEDFFRKFEIAQ